MSVERSSEDLILSDDEQNLEIEDVFFGKVLETRIFTSKHRFKNGEILSKKKLVELLTNEEQIIIEDVTNNDVIELLVVEGDEESFIDDEDFSESPYVYGRSRCKVRIIGKSNFDKDFITHRHIEYYIEHQRSVMKEDKYDSIEQEYNDLLNSAKEEESSILDYFDWGSAMSSEANFKSNLVKKHYCII